MIEEHPPERLSIPTPSSDRQQHKDDDANTVSAQVLVKEWQRLLTISSDHINQEYASSAAPVPFAHPTLAELTHRTVMSYHQRVVSGGSNKVNVMLFRMYCLVGAACLPPSQCWMPEGRPRSLLRSMLRCYEAMRQRPASLTKLQENVFPVVYHYMREIELHAIVGTWKAYIEAEIDGLPAADVVEIEEKRSDLDEEIDRQRAAERPNKESITFLELQKQERDRYKSATPYRGVFSYRAANSKKAIANTGSKLYPTTPTELLTFFLPVACQLMNQLLLEQHLFRPAVVEQAPQLAAEDFARLIQWFEKRMLSDRQSENDGLLRAFAALTHQRFLMPGCATATSESPGELYRAYNGSVEYEEPDHDFLKITGIAFNAHLPFDEQVLPQNVRHLDGVTPYRTAATAAAVLAASATAANSVSLATTRVALETERQAKARADARVSVRPRLFASSSSTAAPPPLRNLSVLHGTPNTVAGRPRYFDELFLVKVDEYMTQAVRVDAIKNYYIPSSQLLVTHTRLSKRTIDGMDERRPPLMVGAWHVHDHLYDADGTWVGERMYPCANAVHMWHTWLSIIRFRYNCSFDFTRPVAPLIHTFVPWPSDAALHEYMEAEGAFWDADRDVSSAGSVSESERKEEDTVRDEQPQNEEEQEDTQEQLRLQLSRIALERR